VFAGPTFTFEDDRFDYPEVRFVTVGLAGRMVVLVWTPDASVLDDEGRRVISMRKANAREQTRFGQRLGEAGRDDPMRTLRARSPKILIRRRS
jgi:uncharacterized DUF497 family protein